MLLLLFTFLFYWALPALILVTISRLALKRSRGTAQPELAPEAEVDVPRTPATTEVHALQLKEQRRASDIICNEHNISLKNLALSGEHKRVQSSQNHVFAWRFLGRMARSAEL